MTSNKPNFNNQRPYRIHYERIMKPIGRKLDGLGVSANSLSILNLIFSIFTTIAFIFSREEPIFYGYVALLFIIIASFFDMMDGSVARAYNERNPDKANSKFGAVLDPALDRYGEAFIILGLLLTGRVPADWILIAFVGMIMASYVRARAESLGMESCSVGIERKEKVFILSLGAGLEIVAIQLAELNIFDLASFYPTYDLFTTVSILLGPMAWGVALVAVLSHIATIQRLKLASEHL